MNCFLVLNSNCDAGTVLRNTEWVVGMVIYCGQETKVQMNSRCDMWHRRDVLDLLCS